MPPLAIALGVGLTNACNLACEHCYRATGEDALTYEEVLRAVTALPIRAVNFGTGESAMHPDFARIAGALADRAIPITMTTNGYSAKTLDDATLARFRDVEVSIDYPSEEAHDAARGAGNWALIEEQMARCKALSVSTTIIAVMMSTNYESLPALAKLAASRGANLRVNVYQAVQTDMFTLTYDQFWRGFRLLFEVADLVVCGEPIVRAALGIPKTPGAGCGVETVRLTPRGHVLPCVYTSGEELSLADLERLGAGVVASPSFRASDVTPEACKACPQLDTCGGGCSARRALQGRLAEPDRYCPFVRGDDLNIRASLLATGVTPPKASSACTTIVRAR